jgi:hypothetical protein
LDAKKNSSETEGFFVDTHDGSPLIIPLLSSLDSGIDVGDREPAGREEHHHQAPRSSATVAPLH